jgi:hypothetical protein
MIDTLDLGQVVKFKPYRHPRDDYAGGGATRPSAIWLIVGSQTRLHTPVDLDAVDAPRAATSSRFWWRLMVLWQATAATPCLRADGRQNPQPDTLCTAAVYARTAEPASSTRSVGTGPVC